MQGDLQLVARHRSLRFHAVTIGPTTKNKKIILSVSVVVVVVVVFVSFVVLFLLLYLLLDQ